MELWIDPLWFFQDAKASNSFILAGGWQSNENMPSTKSCTQRYYTKVHAFSLGLVSTQIFGISTAFYFYYYLNGNFHGILFAQWFHFQEEFFTQCFNAMP